MRSTAIALVLLMITPLMLRFVIMVNYLVEYRYYAEVLCVNQDNPEMDCNGRCALMTELSQVESPGNTQAPSLPDFKVKESVAEHLTEHKPFALIGAAFYFPEAAASTPQKPWIPMEEEPPVLV